MQAPLPNSISALAPELTEWRRDLHQHPELAYEETRTSALVAERLRAFGLDQVETGLGGTGVVGALRGGGGDGEPAIMLRADMDALPLHEADETRPHRSTVEGKMHACGHDGHTTMLLGAAKHLAATRNFKGTVYFCFQPAEEGGAGAAAMIRDGLFERFPCGHVFGMHNWPGLPVGHFAVRAGPMLASADEFRVRFPGAWRPRRQAGQGAGPAGRRRLFRHLGADASSPACVDPLDAGGRCRSPNFRPGSAFNIIPGKRGDLAGTVRSPSTRRRSQR